jgi:hypothetical protein
MSYSLIQEGINQINNLSNLSSFLVKYNHQRNPNQYTCYDFNFSTSQMFLDNLTSMSNAFIRIINKYGNIIQVYTGDNSDKVVNKLSTSSSLICDSWAALKQSFSCSDDTSDIKTLKFNACIFIGTYNNAQGTPENIYFLFKRNPVKSMKKNRFTFKDNVIVETSDPLIQFPNSFDAMIYKNNLYMINSNCENVFNIEYYYKTICQNSLNIIEQLDIVCDIDAYKTYALAGHTPRNFTTYDSNIVSNLSNNSYKLKFESELNIPIDSTSQKFNLSDPKNARTFTLAICGKIKNNMFENTFCEVPMSTPLSP